MESLDDNYDIKPVGKVLDVIEIIFELQPGGINGGYIALMHLRPAGDARLDDVPIDVEGHFTLIPVRQRHRLRARSDPAHLPAQNIDDLWQLIDAIMAQKTPDARDPLIVLERVVSSTMVVRKN